jgi:hypothetical protein
MPHLRLAGLPPQHRSEDGSAGHRARQSLAFSSLDLRPPLDRVRTWIAATAALVTLVLAALAPSAAQAAPDCVDVDHWSGVITQTVKVTNNCPSRVSFIVHRVGPDSPCLHASAFGGWRSYTWGNGLNYQGTTFGCD